MTSRPALFPSAFWPHIGGVEELTRQLGLEQQRLGMQPVIVTMRWPKSLPDVDEVDGLPVLRHVFRVPEPRPRFLGGYLRHARSTRRAIAAQLAAHDVDAVHVQCVSSNARYAQWAAADLGVPLIVTMQGELTMDATGLYQRSAQQRRAWRHLLDAADAVTGCSQFVLDAARQEYDADWAETAVVVPNGIRLSDFSEPGPTPHPGRYVLGIGRLVRQKGFDLLLDAFARLDRADVDLVIAGEGPERDALEDQSRRLGTGERVRFVGPVARPEVPAWFASAAVVAMASWEEPQGIVLLEAMAAGTPVIGTSAGGVPETVVDGENGSLVAPGDVPALASALERVLDGVSQVQLAAARTTADSRDWSQIAAGYQAVYESARR